MCPCLVVSDPDRFERDESRAVEIGMSDEQILDSIELLWDGEIAVAVNKPAGLPTQAPPGVVSLESILRRQFADRGDYLAFPHRLDRPVGGVMVVATRKRAAKLLSEQFAARKVTKQYRAVVRGRVEGQTRWCDDLTKVPGEARVVVAPPNHPEAKTAVTVVEAVSYDPAKDQTILKLCPETGRMHQLRVQASHRGHPIIGDVLYGGPPADPKSIMLVARSLSFHDPRNGKRVTVTGSEPFPQGV